MNPLSITVSVSSLLVTAAKVVKAASALRSQYRDAAFMLSAISSECTVINTSLIMLQSLMMSNPESSRPKMTDHVIATFEVALTGCALTMSVIEDELGGLLIEDENGNQKARRIRYVMEKDHLREMLQQIRGQQMGVSLLLQTYQACGKTSAEVNEMIFKNNTLLRQIANRGRSFYLESVHDGERQASIVRSLQPPDLSIFDMSSSVDDRQFDFDDEMVNAGAYRRTLASLRLRGRFEEEIGNTLPTEDGGKIQASIARTNESDGSTPTDTDNSHQKTPFPGGQEMILATSGTFESETVINQLQDTEEDFMRTFSTYEWILPKTLDPRTGQAFKKANGLLEITEAQRVDLDKEAIAVQSRATLESPAEILAEMGGPGRLSLFPALGGSRITPEQLEKQPTQYRKLKIVVAGDSVTGKTYAMMKYLRGHIDGLGYFPTVSDKYTSDIQIDGYLCQISWEDTAGTEDYDHFRPLLYPNCDVALLFFGINSPDSFENIEGRWAPEIYHFLPHIPKMLVGCKADLRDDPQTIEELAKTSEKPISTQQAEKLARKIGRRYISSGAFQPKVKYMECSSFTGDGIKGLFDEAAKLGIQYSIKKNEMKPRGIFGLFKRRPNVETAATIPEEDPESFATQP